MDGPSSGAIRDAARPSRAARARNPALLLAGVGDRGGTLRPARPADGRGDGLRLLPDPGQELHPARISLPHRLRRRAPRPPAARSRGASALRPQLAALRLAARRPLGLLVPPDPARAPGRAPGSPSPRAGTARLRLATCGGAVLLVNGSEAGLLAPYGRNKEAEPEFAVDLAAGANGSRSSSTISPSATPAIYFQLDWLDGPRPRPRCRSTRRPTRSAEVEAALDGDAFRAPGLYRRRGARCACPRRCRAAPA